MNSLLYLMEEQAKKIFRSFGLAKEQGYSYVNVIEKFEKHFTPTKKIIYERHTFFTRYQQNNYRVEFSRRLAS